MTTPFLFSVAERNEMLRSASGVVTALVSGDQSAVTAQTASIVQEHLDASSGDINKFAARMAKQVEAGARVNHSAIKHLAKRLNVSEADVQEILARALNEIDPVTE